MAPNSVDDMYHGCDDKMAEKVKEEYLPNERNGNVDFKEVWDAAVELYNQNNKNKITGTQTDIALPILEVVAVYAYTSAKGSIYQAFNEAVQTQGPQSRSNFRFHALHYYLTKAVQKLKVSKPFGGSRPCPTVYRRTNAYFRHVAVNTQVRFGFFASCSKLTLEQTAHKARLFGAKTCFEIETCMGGRVLEYAIYETEAEVLIPPYEAFKVTGVKKKSEQKNLPCEVVYTLKSTGRPVSNFNCALFPR